jgi:Predicted Zn-dependent peptidases
MTDSPRHRLITMETVEAANLETLEKYYRMLFNDAAGATFVVVGDIDIDTLKPLVEKYIGSLPKGRKALKWVDDGVRFPRGRIEDIINVDMQTPQSTVVQLHTAYLPYTAERKAALDAISYVLDVRYTNTLREDEGGTYSASASASVTRRPEERMLIDVEFAAKPSLCDRLRELAIEGIRELAANGPTDEEVNQAIQNLKKKLPGTPPEQLLLAGRPRVLPALRTRHQRRQRSRHTTASPRKRCRPRCRRSSPRIT